MGLLKSYGSCGAPESTRVETKCGTRLRAGEEDKRVRTKAREGGRRMRDRAGAVRAARAGGQGGQEGRPDGAKAKETLMEKECEQ